MSALWFGLLAGTMLWLVLCTLLALWARPLPEAPERHPVRTADGWLLTLHRYPPRAGHSSHPLPVIFAHGLNMNRASWVLTPSGDLPRAMAQRGHDVFVLEYRGGPSSQPPSEDGTSDRGRWDYDIEDHVNLDLPAIIDRVQAISGGERVNWVGHSMGGMLIYLYAAQHGSSKLNRVVTLGSPVRFQLPRYLPSTAVRLFDLVKRWRKRLHLKALCWLTLPLSVFLGRRVLRKFLCPLYLGAREMATLCWTSVSDVSVPIHDFFIARAAQNRHLCPGEDEGVEGIEPGGLARLEAPLLVISGERDQVAPPAAVRLAYARAGSPQAAYKHFGDPSGLERGPVFGHCDLASSARSVAHVLPMLADWFEGGAPKTAHPTESRGLSPTDPEGA
ncbi:MAG: alpha/beta fold hydrolase [Myxococcota bacterium]|nr:alpha/beta fold hydrolase [Myxococcota bacterium]